MSILPPHTNRKEIPEYHTWKNMRARCSAPCNKESRHYQSKGIKVDPRWDSFETFYRDMGPKPSKFHSIDRKDNDGDYTPENCRWATDVEQANNKSNTTSIEYEGSSWAIPELSRYLNISEIALRKHIGKGRSIEEALKRIHNNQFLEYNGELKSRQEWADIFNIKLQNLYSRLSKGWSVEKALTTPERTSPNNNNNNNNNSMI